ncbi:hypothetical protein ACUTQ5_03770 [Serratia sp. NA_112.1]|uniref:hypothetical protein n=1 Tax=Serratia sp. NA_112.1 TaxID=3415665 RepID=UPI004046D11F
MLHLLNLLWVERLRRVMRLQGIWPLLHLLWAENVGLGCRMGDRFSRRYMGCLLKVPLHVV